MAVPTMPTARMPHTYRLVFDMDYSFATSEAQQQPHRNLSRLERAQSDRTEAVCGSHADLQAFSGVIDKIRTAEAAAVGAAILGVVQQVRRIGIDVQCQMFL